MSLSRIDFEVIRSSLYATALEMREADYCLNRF
jgi:hypothetical protein